MKIIKVICITIGFFINTTKFRVKATNVIISLTIDITDIPQLI